VAGALIANGAPRGQEHRTMKNSLPVVYQLGCAGVDWDALKQDLLADDFDNGRTPEQLRLSCAQSAVNVFARLNGRVIGTVRVLSDGVGNAYMVDVWTLTAHRGRGIARRMIELALAQLPGQHVYLFTDSAEGLYRKLGFAPQGIGMGRVVGDWLQAAPPAAMASAAAAPADDLIAAIDQAARALRPYVRATPLHHSPQLSELTGADVHLKLENWQHTGSFKLRGAMNKLLSLSPAQRAAGVVAASSGNHGAAVAYGCRLLGATGVVFVPEHAAPAKLAAMRRYGVEVRPLGDDSLVSEQAARRYAAEQGLAYISPYNDPAVVAGQGTLGLEIAGQLPEVAVVFVAVGGGGLISGVAAALKAHNPQVQVIGCLPQNSPVMAVSVQQGEIVELPSLPTLSDGTAGGIETGAITFDLCRALVDDWLLVSEAEIAAAMRLLIEGDHQLVEGAAAVPVAALLKSADRWRGQQVAVILCGGNISLPTLAAITQQ
jgi:threonine dehydratase